MPIYSVQIIVDHRPVYSEDIAIHSRLLTYFVNAQSDEEARRIAMPHILPAFQNLCTEYEWPSTVLRNLDLCGSCGLEQCTYPCERRSVEITNEMYERWFMTTDDVITTRVEVDVLSNVRC